MFELTNNQRKCFGLLPVEDDAVRMVLKPGRYDQHTTISYRVGNTLTKYIESGENVYIEADICDHVSDDLKHLLPKTDKGKPTLLSAATLKKRHASGMVLTYYRSSNNNLTTITLFSEASQRDYYSTAYEKVATDGIADFARWVDTWCSETTQEDIEDVAAFASAPKKHVKFREGDVFRFKISRRLYGYGRILVDYAAMRKKKIPFWDCFMANPLVCSAYHIATDRKDVTVDELKELHSLPSVNMMDNNLYYGTYEIIGNISIGDREDYPIMYGSSRDPRVRAVLFQCGKLYRQDDNGAVLYNDRNFNNSGIGFDLRFKLSLLEACIKAGSNGPYWENEDRKNERVSNVPTLRTYDLRNPKHRTELEEICKQFNISPETLIK